MSDTRHPADTVSVSRAEDAITGVGTLLSDLARRWSGRRLHALNGYREILDAYYSGHADAGKTATAVARLTATEVARYPGELVDLATDYATGLARMARLVEPGSGPDAWPGGGASAQRTVHDLHLSGKAGETVTTGLVIENPREQEVTLGIASAAFANEARVIKLAPAFDPARCTLAPGAEQRIAVSAKLDKRIVKPGESFTAQAVVDGFDDLLLRIHLSVDPA